jgi:hypothetical protein
VRDCCILLLFYLHFLTKLSSVYRCQHIHTVTCMCESRRGFGLDIGFTDHLYTQLQNTNNYSATANLQNSQITIETAKPFPVYFVLTSRVLATTSNSVAALKSSLNGGSLPTASFSQTPVQNSLRCHNFLPYNSSTRTK